MIQQQTVLKVADNSGAKSVKCIKILGGFKKRTAKLGSIITVSIKSLRNKAKKASKVKKGEIYKALVVKTKAKRVSKDGTVSFFNNNSVSLITKQDQPLASRIIGPVSKELNKGKYSKFANIALGTI